MKSSIMFTKSKAFALRVVRLYKYLRDRKESDVAERLGVSQPTYAECERGSNMRIGTLQKIVAALGGELSFHVLIGGRDYNLQMPQPV